MRGKKIIIALSVALAALALTVGGLLHLVEIYESYRTSMLEYESHHLSSIVSTSAYTMQLMIGRYETQALSLLERKEFETAEESYLESADKEVMDELLARPDVQDVDMAYCAVAYDSDWNFLAASHNYFPQKNDRDEPLSDSICLRRSQSGVFWFVFQAESSRGFHYELAVPVQTIFTCYATAASVGQTGYLFLIDGDCWSFSYSGEGVMGTASVDSITQRFPNVSQQALETIAQTQVTPPGDYYIYDYPWGQSGTRTDMQTLVVTFPIMMDYGSLVVGTAVSFREFSSILQDTLDNVTTVVLLVLGGVLALILLAAWIMIMNRRNAMELGVMKEKADMMKEKADMMEELNRQQQSLAHTERLQQLGVMTSGIAHEFNNLLTPIMGQSMLLLESMADHEDSPQFENALDIYEASEKARDVLKGMSYMSKTDVDMQFYALDICALLKKTTYMSSIAKDPHIQQVLNTPVSPVYVSGNEQLLTQAFLNLFINGCQAMGSEGTLTVDAVIENRSGHDYVHVEVKDTGCGIAEKSMNSLFEPFYTTKGEHGTGLGLVICKNIIESHKGTISVGNRPEGGAVFTVRLPVCPPPKME